MKKIFAFSLLLFASTAAMVAQNAHWSYLHASCKPTSAVTVMHSNDTAYLFYADDYTLVVSAIDANTLLPLGIDYSSRGRWSLQGAYEDFSHRIVVYGSYNDAPWAGLFDISSFQFTSSKALPQYTFDNIVNGCCGYDMNDNAINMFVFENQDFILCLDDQLNNPPSATSPQKLVLTSQGPVRVSDIAWDSYNSCFAVCGKTFSNDQLYLFLAQCEYDPVTHSIAMTQSVCWSFTGSAPYWLYYHAEFRPSLEILDDHTIVVGSPIRPLEKGDGIVLSLINNYSTITMSSLFQFLATKLFLFDMKYLPSRNLLTLLGKINYCYDIHYIAQVDLDSLSAMSAAYIIGNVPTSSCPGEYLPVLYSNDIQLQKIEINSHRSFPTFLSTGTYQGAQVYLTETAIINNSVCDTVWEPSVLSLATITSSIVPYQLADTVCAVQHLFTKTASPMFIKECYDNVFDRITGVDSTKSMVLSNNRTDVPTVILQGNYGFVFDNFTGPITYKLYDLCGKLIVSGSTSNGLFNHLPDIKGFYCIVAEDSSGRQLVKKIVVQ
jgi:hypothetical protein